MPKSTRLDVSYKAKNSSIAPLSFNLLATEMYCLHIEFVIIPNGWKSFKANHNKCIFIFTIIIISE